MSCFQEMYIKGSPIEDQAGEIMAPYLFRKASFLEDTMQATDLICNYPNIAVRSRSYDPCFTNYPTQFTIRYKLPSGKPTEIHKIWDGHGDAMFYCFVEEGEIWEWFLIDLNRFRHICRVFWVEGRLKSLYSHHEAANGVEFLAFDIKRFNDKKLVIASSFNIW